MSLLVLAYGVLNAILYAGLLPLWDGFDEPFHYGYVQQLSQHLSLPVLRKTVLSAEIGRSLSLAPASYLVKRNVPEAITFDAYFRLPRAERLGLRAELERLNVHDRSFSGHGLNYEAQQAPLAYAVLAPFDRLWADRPLLSRVLRLRMICAIFSALATGALTLALGRRIGLAEPLRLSAVFLVFSSQMFYATTAHIANDWLAIPLFLSLLVCCIDYRSNPRWQGVMALSAALAAGLLTKSYFLAVVPLAFGAVVLTCRGLKAKWLHVGLFCVISGGLSGPWYIRNLAIYHDPAGMQESIGGAPVWDILKSGMHLPWFTAGARLVRDAIWTGNNSGTVFNFHTVFAMVCLLGAGALMYCVRAFRQNLPWAERFLLWSVFSYCLALAYAGAVEFRYTNGAGVSPSPWYAQVIECPLLCLLLAGIASAGLAGRMVRLALLWIWSYVICATYLAKLVPFYGGYSQDRARPVALLRWYEGAFDPARNALDTVAMIPANVVLGLTAVVTVSTLALALRLSSRPAGTDSFSPPGTAPNVPPAGRRPAMSRPC